MVKKIEQMPILFWNLDELMIKKSITNEQLADATKLSLMTIKNLRGNKCREIEIDVIAKLCYALDCQIGDILKCEIGK